ncbi:MAG: undecaprenyl/decaprenyl-phosphate alpha-N-acetylglucosaminyl 1-phosphate transferase [Alistipes sp.]|nr:undecaprenyl/decaprenyl-phosphate alpha-N-acetylglucosaminyl 1-phosphate transferase [Alistipes sp.]
MSQLWLLAVFAVAFLAVLWLHPKMVAIARRKGITDNPDKRKLQHAPVPVLGGVAVFFGIVVGMGCTVPFCDCNRLITIFALLTIMLYTGTMDDIIGLTPRLRFAIETALAIAAIFIGGYIVSGLHGLWGIYSLPRWCCILLTVVASVGIINAINLIDGVDGLASGFCIMACTLFGIFFLQTDNMMMAGLTAACIGGLIPFFLHNVFGHSSKMFIGDGGTLLMGMIMSLFVLEILNGDNGQTAVGNNTCTVGLIPFTLAVLAIPVFDTLRVMTTRIIRGTSPFTPDKRHLHHAFIGLGFSHIATTATILMLNLAIVAIWYALYKFGCSIGTQFWAVTAAATLATLGIYMWAQAVIKLRKNKSCTATHALPKA